MSCDFYDSSTGMCKLLNPASDYFDSSNDPTNAVEDGQCLDENNEFCSDYIEEDIE